MSFPYLLPKPSRGLLALAIGSVGGLWASPAQAATFTVTNLNNSGAGSLRQAITDANANANADADTINFQSGLSGTITLTSSLFVLDTPMTIEGPASGPGGIILDASNLVRVLNVSNNVKVALRFLTMTGGGAKGIAPTGIASTGGAIYNAGTLLVENCTFTDNSVVSVRSLGPITGRGGAICNIGSLTLRNSTLTANSSRQGSASTSAAYGGAVYNSGTLAIKNCTLTRNIATTSGSGIYSTSAFTLDNCIVAGNTPDSSQIFGSYTGAGNIIVGTAADAGLDSAGLRNNGGSTPTIALVPPSVAIDAGEMTPLDGGFDQRGETYSRISGASIDSGAFEFQSTLAAPTSSNIARTLDEDTSLAFTTEDFASTFITPNIGKSLTGISITSLPTHGTLKVGTTTVMSNRFVSAADLSALSYTPSTDYNGSDTFSFRVTDGVAYSATAANVNLTISPVRDAPTTSISNQTISEDGMFGPFSFTIKSPDLPAASVTVTANSSNTTLVPASNLSVGGSGATRTLTAIPEANQSGTTLITLTLSDGTLSSQTSFTLTVTAVNDAPTLDVIANPAAINEDAGLQTVSLFGISAGGGEDQTLTISATSSNTNLIPTPTVTYTTPNSIGSVSYRPAANQFGTTTINLTVRDSGGLSTTRSFIVTVNAVNDSPSFAPGGDVTVSESSGAYSTQWATNISVGPSNEASQTVAFQVATDNPGLFLAQPTVSPAGVLSFTPAPALNGSASVTVQMQDSGGTANGGFDLSHLRTFTITVVPVNDAPVLSKLEVMALEFSEQGAPVQVTSTLEVSDADSPTLASATVAISSGFLANEDVLTFVSQNGITGTYANGVLKLQGTATLAQYQAALRSINYTNTGTPPSTTPHTLSFSANDGGLTSNLLQRQLTVRANPRTAPEISFIPHQVILEDTSTGDLPFFIFDSESPVSDLQLTVSSSDLSIVAASGITLGQNASGRTIRLTPLPNAVGYTTITMVVTDPTGLSATRSFTVRVNAQNDAPTISGLTNTTMNEDTQFGPLSFRVGDVETPAGALQVSAFSSNTALVPDTGLTLGGSGGERTLTLKPAPNAFGTVTITLVVRDADGATTTSGFVLTIAPVNDAPVATGQALSGSVGQEIGFVLGATDIDGDALVYEIVNFSGDGTLGGGRLSGSAPNLTFTSFTPGIYTLTFRARDAAGAVSNTEAVTFTVGEVTGLTVSGQVLSSEPNANYSASASVPMQSALVRLESARRVVAQTATNSAGRFTFYGVAPSSVLALDSKVRVAAIDPLVSGQVQPLPFVLAQPLKIKVSKKKPLPTQITVNPFVLYSIWGQVNARSADKRNRALTPLAGANVRLSKTASATYPAVSAGTTSNANGFYAFKYLGRARFSVAAQAASVTFSKSGAGATLPGSKSPAAPSTRLDLTGTPPTAGKANSVPSSASS